MRLVIEDGGKLGRHLKAEYSDGARYPKLKVEVFLIITGRSDKLLLYADWFCGNFCAVLPGGVGGVLGSGDARRRARARVSVCGDRGDAGRDHAFGGAGAEEVD